MEWCQQALPYIRERRSSIQNISRNWSEFVGRHTVTFQMIQSSLDRLSNQLEKSKLVFANEISDRPKLMSEISFESNRLTKLLQKLRCDHSPQALEEVLSQIRQGIADETKKEVDHAKRDDTRFQIFSALSQSAELINQGKELVDSVKYVRIHFYNF